MRFRRIFLALLLVMGTSAVFWLQKASLEPVKQDVPVPSVAVSESFFQIPWGISKTEVLNLAKEKNFQSMPGSSYYGGPRIVYRISFAGYPAQISLNFLESIKTDYSFFYQGSISMDKRTCPIEKIYWQLHKELTERYGQTPELGYPPRRNSDTEKPWGPGSGAIWEIKSPDGQLFEIEAVLDLSDTGFLQLKYRNLTVERRFKTMLNPTLAGDPTQAESDLMGFMDNPWGSTPAQFRQGIEKHGFLFVKEYNDQINRTARMKFNNGTYADYPIDSVSAYFKHNSMYLASVDIRGDESDNGDAVYNDLKSFLEEQYGMPLEEKNFRGDTFHIWQFPLEGFKPNCIMLHRYGTMVMIGYTNQALEEKLNSL